MELSLLQALFFLLLLLLPFFLYLLVHRREHSSKNYPITHGHKSYPLLGYLPHYINNRNRYLEWASDALARSPSHTIGYAIFGGRAGCVVTADPRNVEHMLKINFANYPKGELSISVLEDFLGRGIFNSDGEQWRRQRKAASFEFNKRSLRAFVVDTVRYEIAERLLPLLEKAEENCGVVDLQDVLERFGFDSICRVAFGEDPGCLTEEGFAGRNFEFMKAFEEVQDIVIGRFMAPVNAVWGIKRLLDVGSERRLRELISVVHSYAEDIIRARREKGGGGADDSSEQKSDLLSRFAADESHSEEFLRDTVTNFLLAGRETTSSALVWFFWLVSVRPDVQQEIADELRSIRSAPHRNSGEAAPEFDELREMQYLHAAITESMRLYPPVPLDTQSCREDDVMPDGTFVGKGWKVSYSAYAMGRLRDLWGPDCEEYRPERWLENGAFRPESPFKYPVFHAGPRMCLGKEMAYIQMKSIAAAVLERYKIQVVGKERKPESVLSFTLRMKGGLPVRIRKKDE